MLRDYEKYHKEGNALHQARNQLGSPDGMKSFLKRAQILCPTHCYRGFAAPGYGPALHPLKRRHFFSRQNHRWVHELECSSSVKLFLWRSYLQRWWQTKQCKMTFDSSELLLQVKSGELLLHTDRQQKTTMQITPRDIVEVLKVKMWHLDTVLNNGSSQCLWRNNYMQ